MNVTNRHQFDLFLKALKTYTTKVVDTETNGLYPYNGDKLISLSVFFPESPKKEVYNLAFFQGEGTVEIKWTENYPEGTPFEEMKWTGKAKKQSYLAYWFEQFKECAIAENPAYFENLPTQWLEEVKAVWGKGVYIFHNSRFDAHVLYASGFPDMEMVYDTMIALHIVFEDWQHIQLMAPYTWTYKDAPSKDQIGMWAVDENGQLLKKLQQGNRRLKWQAAYHGFKDATVGETELFTARRAFENTLVDFIMDNISDPINDDLLLARVKNGKATKEDWDKQRAKIAAKIEVDDKANLWMLPGGSTAHYAELDVLLTWDLYQWCLGVIKDWDNLDLFENQSHIHHFVAWEMERNGFKLDVQAAQAQIDLLQPRIDELTDTLVRLGAEWNIEGFNPNSPKTLLPFLNSGVLGYDYGTSLFPDWFDVSLTTKLKVYPEVYVRSGDLDESGDELFGTDKRELEKVEDHPVVRILKELRKMQKSVKTYLQKWIDARDPNDIVRFAINDDGTVSGRASSSGDAGNGQNIPDRGGYTVKKAIVAPDENWRFVAIDYGQLELRLGAWVAETLLGLDNNMSMTKLFLSGADMHSYVRDLIDIRTILYSGMNNDEIVVTLGYSPTKLSTENKAEIVAKHCRQVAKTMNFGLLYSGGAGMLAKLLKIDKDVAGVLVKKWRALFPAFPRTQERITEDCLERRLNPGGQNYGMYCTQPISGRHRKLHLYSTQYWYFEDGAKMFFNPREAAARKVFNNLVQGLGGFLCMASAYNIGEELGRDKVRMFCQIHDALEMYVHVDYLHLVPRIGEIMTDWPDIVPELTVDISGSRDGTWQGISSIVDMDKWIATKGAEGY